MQINIKSKHSNAALKEIVVKIDDIHIKSLYVGSDNSFSYMCPQVTYVELIFKDGWVQVYTGFEVDTTKMRLLQWDDALATMYDNQEEFYIGHNKFTLYSLYKIGTTYSE